MFTINSTNWTYIDSWASFSTNCSSFNICGSAITGVNLTELIDSRVRFNWDDMNQGNCVVDQIRIRYREVGTNVTKTMGSPVGNGIRV